MEIQSHILNKYYTVAPFEGISSIEEKLLEKGYVVVADENGYIGILTTGDLIKHPHKIVIDCLTEKGSISFDETIISALDKFKNIQCPALPVFRENRFIGIVEKYELINELISRINHLYNKSLISEQLKNKFLRNLSHEIGTPLNGLLGFLEMVSKLDHISLGSNESLEYSMIKNCADKFLLVMGDLIDLSLIDSGDKIRIIKEPVTIENIFSDLKEFFRFSTKLTGKNLSISYINPDTSLTLLSDGGKIKHILYHLIDNSIKSSDDGIVNYGYKIEDQNIVFYVTNNGSIYAEEYSHKVSEAFNKKDFYEDEGSTLGIGLPLAKKMSELLGGKVDFASDNNEIIFKFYMSLN